MNRIQKIATSFNIACALVIVVPTPSSADDIKTLVIADERAEYGLPAPYLHRLNGPGYIFASYVFDTLVGQDDNGALAPGLAKKWSRSDDGLTYTIQLNPTARWHDGKSVSPQDVVFTFEYVAKNPYAFVSVEGVKRVSVEEQTVTIQLKTLDSGFVNRILTGLPILPAHIYAEQNEPRRFDGPTALIGSGPYRLASFDRAQGRYLLTASNGYYGGKQKYDEIIIARLSAAAALTGISNGEVDLIPYLPWSKLPEATKAGISVVSAPSHHPLRLTFNHGGLFKEKKARQALAHMIDRDALVRIAYTGGAIAAQQGYFQTGTEWYVEGVQATYPYDLNRAAALLENTGWVLGNAGRWMKEETPITIRLISDTRRKRQALVLAEQLEAGGFSIDLRTMKRGALQDIIQSGDFDLALTTTSTIGDPSGLSRRILGKSWSSDGYRENSKLRDVIEEQARTLDKDKRRALLAEFQTLYSEELPSLMLANPIWSAAHSNQITPIWFQRGVAIGIPSPISKPVLMLP